MRGESMKDKSKKSTYSTTFGVDPNLLTSQVRQGRSADPFLLMNGFWNVPVEKLDDDIVETIFESIVSLDS